MTETLPPVEPDKKPKDQPEKKDAEPKKEAPTEPQKVEDTATKSEEMLQRYKLLYEQAKAEAPDKFKVGGVTPPDAVLAAAPKITWEKAKIKLPDLFTAKGLATTVSDKLTAGPQADPLKVRLEAAGFLPSRTFQQGAGQVYLKTLADLADKATKTTVIKSPAISF